jgi:putative ABC transport system permease protein
MIAHDLRLAWRSLARSPYLSVLMIGTLAVGMTASMIAFTLYHSRAGHPIPWKDETLFAVALDARDEDLNSGFSLHPEYPPSQLTYRDARALYTSAIPMRSVMMFRASQIVTPGRQDVKAFGASIRVTTADFFATFDVPFQYGAGWSRADDEAPSNVVVLSKFMNEKLFGGANSVGREVILGGHSYRVLGVVSAWLPRPKYYDLNSGLFVIPEDVFMPFGWMQALKLSTAGATSCISKHSRVNGFESLLLEDCVWLQFWVEFRHPADRYRYQVFLDSYTNDWRLRGRFPRRNNNRIVNVPTWLSMWDVVGDESRTQVVLGLAFLGVCILNTLGLMLAKFLSAAPLAGLRRALGASRMDIVRQYLMEVMFVGILGGAAGLALTFAGLALLKKWLYSDSGIGWDNPDRVAMMQAFVHMDLSVILFAVGLSVLAGALAGLYPAYRISKLAPATFLRAQ